VPTEEEPGIAILAALLERFAVIATEDEEADCDVPLDRAMMSATAIHAIDVEDWIIETAELQRVKGEEQQPCGLKEGECQPTSGESEVSFAHPSQSPSLPIARRASAAAMLQILPPDYRAPAIQIGFNFAESDS